MKRSLTTLLVAISGLGAACLYVPLPKFQIGMNSEGAIIVWDGKAKVEHFVRTAEFASTGPHFGFLVPTPSKPALREVSPKAFDLIRRLVDDFNLEEQQRSRRSAMKGLAGAAASRLQVENVAVAGYDASILKATDASALAGWLGKHGYAMDARGKAWLEKYVKNGWYLTAFRVKSSGGTGRLGAVDIAFRVERPFYPFREPDPDPARPFRARRLAIAFIGDEPMGGEVATVTTFKGETYANDWLPEFSRKLTDVEVSRYADLLQLPPSILAGKTASLLIDHRGARYGARDFTFAPARGLHRYSVVHRIGSGK